VATKRSGSSAPGKHPAKKGRHMPDRKIDFSDIPELSDQQLRHARRVGRPPTGRAKQLIALRVSPDLLARLKRMARRKKMPYQTLMHVLLEKAAFRG
jgi:predicted DNA binding CopG/RHH family protein